MFVLPKPSQKKENQGEEADCLIESRARSSSNEYDNQFFVV